MPILLFEGRTMVIGWHCRWVAAVGFAAVWSVCFSAVSPAQEGPALRKVIDQQVSSAWTREKVHPAPLADDAEFLRRVSIDLVGSIPTYAEAVEFLENESADKREKLVERLLSDPRFAQHQGEMWDLLLFGRNPPGYDTDKREGMQAWLRDQFAKNTPYDAIAKAILRAEGNTVEQGPAMFYVQYRNQPEDAIEAITQTFLGVQLQCARCHDHPYEPWTQLDFYGMAGFLSRLDVVKVGKKDQLTMYAIGEKSTGDILFTGPAKDQKAGKKGDPVKPKFLKSDELTEPALPDGFKEIKFEDNKQPPKPHFSRKDQLADWIASPENPYFARAIANRIWAQFLGRGIVHPVDNMSPSNPPSHPELLDELTKQLTERKFDLRWYIRELVLSETYQRSSRGGSGEQYPLWFESARWRPLSAEELVDAWRVGTGYDEVEKASGKPPEKKSRFRPLEGGYMVRFFGQPNSGAGDFQGGLTEHLYLNNGQLGQLISTAKGSLAEFLADEKTPVEERVDRLYLSILSRKPDLEEKQRFSDYLTAGDAKERSTRQRDAIWTLMTCSEFRFNH
jgi:hypothetical protein